MGYRMAFLEALGGGIASGLLGIVGQHSANQTRMQIAKDTNQMQMDMFNQQFDYTKQTQAEAWRREDNQLERRVADAQNAGLSPIAALGGSNQASIVSQPSAPHLIAPQIDSITSGVNFDSAIDALIQDKRLKIEQQMADTQAKKVLNDDENTKTSLQQTAQIEVDKLKLNNEQFTKNLQNEQFQFDKKLGQDMTQFNRTLELSTRAQTFNEKLQYQKYLIDDVNSIVQEANSKTGGQSSAYKVYTEENSYRAAMNAWISRYNDFITTQLSDPTKLSLSQADSASASTGMGASMVGSVNASASDSMSQSISKDYSERDRQKVVRWLNSNPVPIYRPGRNPNWNR